MCTNYFLDQTRAQFESLFGGLTESDWENPEPRKAGSNELYPAYEGVVVHRGSNLLARYRWGLDNFMDPKRLLVNARSETVHTSRTFAKAFRETRCLVPAHGYYEYRQSDPVGKKRRYIFKAGEGESLFAFAGLWQERGGIRSYTIITTEPNAVAREIHDRMPVVLATADFEKWLDPNAKPDELLGLLVPWQGPLALAESPKAKAVKTGEEPTAKKGSQKAKPKDEGQRGLFSE